MRNLAQLSKQELRKAIKKALMKSYVSEIIKNTPTKTGKTKSAWELVEKEPFKFELRNDRFRENIQRLEEGTKPHTIEPKDKEALRFESGGEDIIVKIVEHPGFEGRHFIKKSLANKLNNVKFSQEIRKELRL